jgi:hypothetical protein
MNENSIIDLKKFCHDNPDHENSFKLFDGAWKFSFDKISSKEIMEFLLTVDGRPRLTSEIFQDFKTLSIVEFGPADGYNTAQLEIYGASNIISIESNVDAYMKCLVMKNFMNLRGQFLLGDFLKYLDSLDEKLDLAYASGVLYHLIDPVNFLLKIGKHFDKLFLWSLYYDSEAIASDAYELRRFKDQSVVKINNTEFTYHKRLVDESMLPNGSYQGGIVQYSNWLSLADIEKAINLAGFSIVKIIPDNVGKMKAMNFWASKL